MLMMSFACLAVVTVVWVVAGYSLAFGNDTAGGLIGSLEHAGMAGIGARDLTGSVPTMAFAAFQLMFAIITAALLSGAIADRAKFGDWVGFVAVWVIGGLRPDRALGLRRRLESPPTLRIQDLAGGTVVEVNSGASAWPSLWCSGRGWGSAPRRCARTACRW